MTARIIVKACALWFAIAVLAVCNGILRETVITPLLGAQMALPLSGLILMLAIFLVSYFAVGLLGATNRKQGVFIGLQWLLMTLAFEFIFGHLVAGKSWDELLVVFDIRQGDLFSLVLLSTLLSPCIAISMQKRQQ